MATKKSSSRVKACRRLSRADAEGWLRKLVDTKQQLDQQWESLFAVMGVGSETPFGAAVWSSFDVLVDAVSDVVDDPWGTVWWFVWDNELGTKSLEHSLPDGTMREVETIHDLLDVLGY